jgi:hypothetical protein
LDCDLSAVEDEGRGAQDISSSGVSAQRGALACSSPDFHSSRVIEHVAGEYELVTPAPPVVELAPVPPDECRSG